MHLSKGERFSYFSELRKKSFAQPHLVLWKRKANEWTLSAFRTRSSLKIEEAEIIALDSNPHSYRKALSTALRYADFYNLPLIKPVLNAEYLVLWGSRKMTAAAERQLRDELFKSPLRLRECPNKKKSRKK